MIRRRRDVLVAAVLAVGAVVGVALVLTAGGSDDEPVDVAASGGDRAATATTELAPGASSDDGEDEPRPLPLDDLSRSGIEALSGLALPEDTQDLLTARLDDGAQLDVTFTIPPDAESAFVDASGLASLEADRRVVQHSSPLWKLNPSEDAQLRGTLDETDQVVRAVELVDEGERVRARVVLTAA